MFQLGLDMAQPSVEAACKTAAAGAGDLLDCVISVIDAPMLSLALRDAQGKPGSVLCENVELFPLYERGSGPEPQQIFEAAVHWLFAIWSASERPVKKGFIRGLDDPPLGATLSESKRCWSLHDGDWGIDPRYDP